LRIRRNGDVSGSVDGAFRADLSRVFRDYVSAVPGGVNQWQRNGSHGPATVAVADVE